MRDLPNDKALGLDGLTSEVLKACWSWVNETLLDLVRAFWQDGNITVVVARGVLCLIPKGGDLDFLRSWHPIMMLNLVYKITNKLITNRLKRLMGLLVDNQQLGFVLGKTLLTIY